MLILSDSTLGDLELRSAPFTVVSFQIGPRTPREVRRNRALADGEFDDTKFSGARPFTLALRLNEKACNGETMQSLLDLLLPYSNPRRRPTLKWSIPGSASDVRWSIVRGVGAPYVIAAPKHASVVCSFIAPTGEVLSDLVTLTLDPSGASELGRSYSVDRTYDRTYPASLPVGDRLATNRGNARAHWRATIYGSCTNPTLTVGGRAIAFTNNGGLVLPAGGAVTIDTRERTIYYLDDPTQPKYQYTNFSAWAWDDLLLEAGETTVNFGASVLGTGARVEMSWYPTWEG